MIILVMGLPGSGKTTLAARLVKRIEDSVHINADQVREANNDWDFSYEGRLRQARRMNALALDSEFPVRILDFICPLEEFRKIINPDILIYMDTITEGRYDDTNQLFEAPQNWDIRVVSHWAGSTDAVVNDILELL